MSNPPANNWVYLDRKPGSIYRQLFIKGRNIAARTIYSHYLSECEPKTPEQIAEDYQLPVEAVREAIAYCQLNPPEIQLDWEADEALEEARGTKAPDYPSHGRSRRLTPDELARFGRL